MADVHHDMPELGAGSALGPYELIAPIGVGGMARVWAARVRGKTEIVALKMLLPELAENVEFRKMFFDEARIASRVRHPNVCSTFEMGEQQGTLYLAMEWLDGPSLMRVLRPGREDVTECERIPIRPRIAARIVADACAGLHAAHELVGDDGRPLAVVHRDVSPHNLLMTSAGEVKITDFGVAKALGKSHMTIAGQLKGKLAYMAPEQLVGGSIDRRCDVFALGCVLYEITTGQRPFQGEHDPQVMASIMLGRYEPPSALVAGYPHQLSIIVMRALANEPDHRYASAEEMRRALEAYLRASGPQVGAAQVAALVHERCGSEVEARANAVHGAAPAGHGPRLALGAPSKPNAQRRQSGQPPHGSHRAAASESGSGAILIDEPSAASRKPMLWMAVAALVGASLGIGVLSYVRSTRKPRAQPVAAASADLGTSTAALSAGAPSSAATGAVPGVSGAGVAAGAIGPAVATGDGGTAGPAITLTASSGSPPGSIAPARVHLRISPATAIVIIDGVVLPRGTDTIAKPSDGATMNVLVRADKHEDTIVMVDSATPDEVEVTLVPRAVLTPASAGGASAASTRPRATPNGNSASAKDAGTGAAVIDAPPNPYE